jgi:hypothetical protein
MYTGQLINELMGTVARAEKHAREPQADERELALKSQLRTLYHYEFMNEQQLVEVA